MNYTLHLPENYVKPPLPGRDEWLEALRSGRYAQGRLSLCESDKYCCLGVLCRLQGRLNFLDGKWREEGKETSGLSYENPVYKNLDALGRFPEGVFVRLSDSEIRKEVELAGCNDSGLTFDDISNIIEAVWDNAPKNW